MILLLDLDGTLVYTTPRMLDLFHALARELAPEPLPPERLREIERWSHYYWLPSPEFRADLHLSGGRRDHAFWTRYAEKHLGLLGVPLPPPAVLDAQLVKPLQSFVETARREEHLMEGAREVLSRLHARGHRLALVTNRDAQHPPVSLDGLGPYFEVVVTAGEVGYWKPDPRIFQAALTRLGVSTNGGAAPRPIYYLGDNYYADVLGARAAGLEPILLDPHGLFPEAGCPVIRRLSELPDLLACREVETQQASR